MNIQGKTALITGASGGIGKAIKLPCTPQMTLKGDRPA